MLKFGDVGLADPSAGVLCTRQVNRALVPVDGHRRLCLQEHCTLSAIFLYVRFSSIRQATIRWRRMRRLDWRRQQW